MSDAVTAESSRPTLFLSDADVASLADWPSAVAALADAYARPVSAAMAQCTFDGECDPRYPFKSLCANYFCNDGQCSGPVAVNCDDKNVCTIDGCSEQRAGCFHDPKCLDDGLACNGEEYCCTTTFCLIVGLYGQCRHRGLECGDSNPCTCDACPWPGR